MLVIDGLDIHLTRGDTAFIEVIPTNEDGSPYEMQEGDKIFFRLKRKSTDDTVICEKEVDVVSMTLQIDPEDTEPCQNGKDYRYEFELVTAAGYHFTFIEDQLFHIGVELEVHADEPTGE